MNNEDGFLDWFAGFVCGDGCFCISGDKHRHYSVSLHITQRVANVDLLHEMRERLGFGSVYVGQFAQIYVGGVKNSLCLIKIFDEHPVRGAKQREYEVWRQAVLELKRGGGEMCQKGKHRKLATYDRDLLQRLKEDLMSNRARRGKR